MNSEQLVNYKILELWPETMAKTGSLALLAIMSELEDVDWGLSFSFESYDSMGCIFVIPHELDLAYYLRNNPEMNKQINHEDFFEGNINMKGLSYKGFYHNEYIKEVAIKNGEHFLFEVKVDEENILSKFIINIKKASFRTSGRPENGEFSLGEIDTFFTEINKFLKEPVIRESESFVSRPNGLIRIEVIFQNEPLVFGVSKFDSFGFSHEEIVEIIDKMETQVLNMFK